MLEGSGSIAVNATCRKLLITNARIITPFETLEDCSIAVDDGRVSALIKGDVPDELVRDLQIFDAKGMLVTPGLIDIHTHGGAGEDCLGGDLEKISRFKLSQGVTGYLATLIAAPLEMIYESIGRILEFSASVERKGARLARILGIHIEGVYLNPEWRGAQPLVYLRKPDVKECREIIERSKGLLKLMTVSPEVEGCLEVIGLLSDLGVVASVGHSDASWDVIDRAIARGLRHVTHIFNAMDGERFSEPGVMGAGLAEVALVRDELTAEVIGELSHVSPILMEILFRTKGPDRIIIVTDSLSVAGLPAGKYKIGVLSLALEEGATAARLEDGGLAGSVVPLNKAVKTFLDNTSSTLNQAIQMATFNPARSLGLSDRKGSIEVGKDADIAIFDENLETVAVFVAGELAYEREKHEPR